jgi:hypothetical protein
MAGLDARLRTATDPSAMFASGRSRSSYESALHHVRGQSGAQQRARLQTDQHHTKPACVRARCSTKPVYATCPSGASGT